MLFNLIAKSIFTIVHTTLAYVIRQERDIVNVTRGK